MTGTSTTANGLRPESSPATHTEQTHQYVIVGAGPAGLQLSYFLHRAGVDHLVVERAGGPGTFFRAFPRHRQLISLNKVHTTSPDPEIRLRWDWNSLLNDVPELMFPEFSQDYYPRADDLVRYLEAFVASHRLPVRYDCAVTRIDRDEHGFLVDTAAGPLRCQCLVVATGWGRPYLPPVRGIELAIGYEQMHTDPAHYAGQRVLIIGKGNSAFETASALLGHASMVHLASPNPLRLAWNTKHPGDVRGHHGAVLDSYQFKTLHSVLDCVIDDIRRVDDHYDVDITYTHADGETDTLSYDSVLRCTGFAMDTSVFTERTRPPMTARDRLPELAPDWSCPTVPDLYFAGTIAQARDLRRASSAFIDGFRYNIRTLAALLTEKYNARPLPFDTHRADADVLTDLVLDRVNWSSALWTQFEYLCDVLVGEPDTNHVRHYRDLPEDYAVQRFRGEADSWTVTLRWGRANYADVFNIERHPQPNRATESAFIHPVIRHYRYGVLVGEQHLLEDLLAEWRRPDRHYEPLRTFFTHTLVRALTTAP